MADYRRDCTPGATWFFTLTLADRGSDLLVRHADELGRALRAVRAIAPFECPAIVVLPDHLHCLWSLPPGDSAYPQRWRRIKAGFSRSLPNVEARSARRWARGERGIWQQRYWEHRIRGEEDFRRHVEYIHYNPVKHGLVEQVSDWPYSSFHRYVAQGVYPADWGGRAPAVLGRFGE